MIGAGPAGLTVAIILAQHGYKVTIFEQQDKIGGITRYGIPEFRLPKSILDRLEKQILAMGIRIRPHTAIGTVLTIDDLFRDGYASVFVGTGVWKARNLGIPGNVWRMCISALTIWKIRQHMIWEKKSPLLEWEMRQWTLRGQLFETVHCR